jgi:hypothetical protein
MCDCPYCLHIGVVGTAAHLCSKIHNMRSNPHVAWEYICPLTKGNTVHHKKKVQIARKMTDGKLASNGKEKMTVFGPHFNRIFNKHCPDDPTILDNIPQCPIFNNIDSPITFAEVDAAINKLKNGKSPGLNGIPPEAYRVMNTETQQLVHGYATAFYEGDADYDGWHTSQCVQSLNQAIYPIPTNGAASC